MNHLIGTQIIQIIGCSVYSEQVQIVTDRGTLILFHNEDCCETVSVEEIHGNPEDLIGAIVMVAESRSSVQNSTTDEWTFYHFITTKGDLTIRWYGESNGYYSMDVSERWNGCSSNLLKE